MIQRAILSMIAFTAIAVSIATCALMREVTLRLLALVSVLLVVSASTRAEDVSEGAYFCTTIAAGGVAYNATLKKWEGTVFRPDGKICNASCLCKAHKRESRPDRYGR
jgi:hypothetical protein